MNRRLLAGLTLLGSLAVALGLEVRLFAERTLEHCAGAGTLLLDDQLSR